MSFLFFTRIFHFFLFKRQLALINELHWITDTFDIIFHDFFFLTVMLTVHILYTCISFQRKGLPYCHRPCYARLFGPQMMGYGSNVVSPANFKRNGDGTLYNGEFEYDLKQVFESGKMIHNSPPPGVSSGEKCSPQEPRCPRLGPNPLMEFNFFSDRGQNINGSPKKTEYTQKEWVFD